MMAHNKCFVVVCILSYQIVLSFFKSTLIDTFLHIFIQFGNVYLIAQYTQICKTLFLKKAVACCWYFYGSAQNQLFLGLYIQFSLSAIHISLPITSYHFTFHSCFHKSQYTQIANQFLHKTLTNQVIFTNTRLLPFRGCSIRFHCIVNFILGCNLRCKRYQICLVVKKSSLLVFFYYHNSKYTLHTR